MDADVENRDIENRDIEIRPITASEVDAYVRTEWAAFSVPRLDDKHHEVVRAMVEVDRALAAFDGDRVVGTAGAFAFELTLPGATTVPVPGVTAVGVLATHRRRGILTRLMQRQLDDVAARGEPLAVLFASEGSIYGRFGYGPATQSIGFSVAKHRADWARPYEPRGRVVFLEEDDARKRLPEVYDGLRRVRPGAVSRPAAWWAAWFHDPEIEREGATPLLFVVHEDEAGDADGYLAYRVKHDWGAPGLPGHELRVVELLARDLPAHQALWHHCLHVDLMTTVSCYSAPVDEVLGWLLGDPYQMRVTSLGESLWVRLLDVPAALAARRYSIQDALVIEVADAFRPANDGCYRLEGGPDGAGCQPTFDQADLAMPVAELGSLYLGGFRPSALAAAGRIAERTPGSLARADAMFAATPAPWCATDF